MSRYAINVFDYRVVAATGETLRQSAYRALSARTAEDIRLGRIDAKTVVWQILRRENVQGRKPEDIENLRPDNVRKVVFRQDPADDTAVDDGFVAEVGEDAEPEREASGDGGDAPDAGDGGLDELRKVAESKGLPWQGMDKDALAALVNADAEPGPEGDGPDNPDGGE